MIPADMRLLSAKDLFISQAALRESYPAEKHAKVCEDDQQSETSQNLVLYGKPMSSVEAEGIIVSVGNDTLFGHVGRNAI